MQARFLAAPAVLAAVLAAACSDTSPTSVPHASAPTLHHRPGHGGGDDGGGKPNFGPAITIEFRDDLADNIGSDGRGTYVDRECGVSATFNLNDARLDPDANKIGPKERAACGGRDPRKVMVAFTDPVGGSQPGGRDGSTVGANFFKANEVEFVTEADGTVDRTLWIHGAGCAHGLRFSPGSDSESDAVEVTKNPDGTWIVRTKPSPDNVAVCIPDEDKANAPPRSYYHMPFRITVRLK